MDSKIDIEFYRNFYSDLNTLTEDELISHYNNHGESESRICSLNNFLNKYSGFDINFYKLVNSDLNNLDDFELLKHYDNYGRFENRVICKKDKNKVNNLHHKEISFIHFGERCQPIIIINLILKIHRKTLFQLAIHPFNTLIKELEDGNFMDIINLQYLKYDNEYINYLEEDLKNGFGHDSILIHQKYEGIRLVHDYSVDDNKITNYNFLNNNFKIKIDNFMDDINNKKFLCFITFMLETNINNLEFDRMINVLKDKYKIQNFIICIFTNDVLNENLIIPDEYEIIYIDQVFGDYTHRSIEYRVNLYKEIYIKFQNIIIKYGYILEDFDENDVSSRIHTLTPEYLDFLSKNNI